MSDYEASVLALSGHVRRANIMSRRAVGLSSEKGRRDAAAQHQAGAAVREALLGIHPRRGGLPYWHSVIRTDAMPSMALSWPSLSQGILPNRKHLRTTGETLP